MTDQATKEKAISWANQKVANAVFKATFYSVGICQKCGGFSLWGGDYSGLKVAECLTCKSIENTDFHPFVFSPSSNPLEL